MLEIIQNLSTGQWSAIIIVLLSLIQIAPIKINPWSILGTVIGRAINKEVMAKQDRLCQECREYRRLNDLQIKSIIQKFDKRGAEDVRNRILRFGDEIRNKQIKHSEEYYNQILADITDYNKYCKEHPNFPNARTVATTGIIREAYEEHLKNNDFL